MKDLFGNETEYQHTPTTEKRGRNANPKGYAGKPGTGPKGETCGSCRNIHKKCGSGRAYLKCRLIRWRWTGGAGTDILARTPACERWEPWETLRFRGLIVRIHRDYEAKISKDEGTTWKTARSYFGRTAAYEQCCCFRVHNLRVSGVRASL